MDTSVGEDDNSGPLTEVIPSVECAAYKKIAANYFWYTIHVQVLMAWDIFGKNIIKILWGIISKVKS